MVVITTFGALRQFIKEEVERNMRWTAGFGGGGLGQAANHASSPYEPLPGLGTPDDELLDDKENTINGKEEKKVQLGAREEDE